MAVTAPDLIQPTGRIAPDLIPRTPDEVAAYDADESGYATSTAKTSAYVAAFIAAAPAAADTDALVTLYAYWRAYEARADVMESTPATGTSEGEGSYGFTTQQITAARALANRYEAEYEEAANAAPEADPVPLPRRSVVIQPTVRW